MVPVHKAALIYRVLQRGKRNELKADLHIQLNLNVTELQLNLTKWIENLVGVEGNLARKSLPMAFSKRFSASSVISAAAISDTSLRIPKSYIYDPVPVPKY